MSSVPSTFLAVFSLALTGAIAAPYVVRFAAARAAKQPLPYDPAAEESLLEYVRAHPEAGAAPEIAELFVSPYARAEFDQLVSGVEHGVEHDVEHSLEYEEADDAVVEKGSLPAELVKLVAPLEDLAFDREHYPGACGVQLVDAPPFVQRSASRMSALRYTVIALACAASGALAGYIASSVWASLAVLLLAVAGWVIALVDHDTLFLDIKTWWSASALAGACVSAHVLDTGDTSLLGWSLLAGAVWWGLFEGINLLYKLWRGIDGIGGGDGQIAFSVVFVSVALTGSLGVALWSVMAGMVVSLLASIPLMLMKRRGRRDAFALGPFLACGWQLTLLLHAAGFIV